MPSVAGKRRGTYGERLNLCGLRSTFLAFVFLYAVFLVIGAAGPEVLVVRRTQKKFPTAGEEVDYTLEIDGMNPLMQGIWVTAALSKPARHDGSSLRAVGLSVPVTFEIEAAGAEDGVTRTFSSHNHTRMVKCRSGKEVCQPLSLFARSAVEYSAYRLRLRFFEPMRPFQKAEGRLGSTFAIQFAETHVSEAYTRFEVGFKFFFFTVSLLLLLAFGTLLYLQEEKSQRRWCSCLWRLSLEQCWTVWLLFFLCLLNDPFVLAAVYSPDPGWPGLSVFLTITALCAILLFWLVETHVVARVAEKRLPNSARLALSSTFYTFKGVFVALFWAFSLSIGMYAMYQLESDPAFSLYEGSTSQFASFGVGIAATFGAIYLIWLLFYVVLALRHLRSLPGHLLLQISLIFAAALGVVGSYFGGAAFLGRDKGGAVTLLAFYASANLYVWFLLFTQIPADVLLQYDLDVSASRRDEAAFDERIQAADQGVFDTDLDVVIDQDDVAQDDEDEHGAKTQREHQGGAAGGDEGARGRAAATIADQDDVFEP